MNKSSLVEALSRETDLSPKKAEEVVKVVFDEMTNALINDDRVEIRGFCSMFVKQYEGYTGRNPKNRRSY